MRYITFVAAMATSISTGCVSSDDSTPGAGIRTDPLLVRDLGSMDVGVWSHDDRDGTVDPYLSFSGSEYESGDDAGVFVDTPCAVGDLIIARFVGFARGDWQYRASFRLTIEPTGEQPSMGASDIAGAQALVSQPASDQHVVPVVMQGVTQAEADGLCRVGIKGKAFAGSVSLFGAGSLIVERHISLQ